MSEKITTPSEMVRFLDDVKEKIASLKRKHAESRQPDPVPTSVTHSCARCAVECPHVGEREADAWFAKHGKECEKRPLEVGDMMRATFDADGSWLEGEVTSLRDERGHAVMRPTRGSSQNMGYVGRGRFTFCLRDKNCRRIPRPLDEVKTPVYDTGCNHVLFDGAAVFDIRHEYGQRVAWCGACGDALDAPPRAVETPVLHDGMSTMECYRKWCDNRALVERGGPPLYTLTPAQISAGRATYLSDALSEHSAELRAKVEAAKEREMMQVVVGQDGEDFSW